MPVNLIPLFFSSNGFRKVELSAVCVSIYACTYIYVDYKSCIPDQIHEPVLGCVSQLFIVEQIHAWERVESCSYKSVLKCWNLPLKPE